MPRWVYASWSIGLFLYQTFDAVDGTQAQVESRQKEMGYPADRVVTDGELTRVAPWASSSTMVSRQSNVSEASLKSFLGVDACNTAFETLLFAAAMNMGQSWKTVLTLFGSKYMLYQSGILPS